MKIKSIATVTGTIVITALAALGVSMIVSAPGVSVQAQEGTRESSKAKPVSVVVVQPSRRALTRSLKMPATLLPREMADLFAKTSGYISTIEVDIGSEVRVGDVLATIEVPEMADELRQAEAVVEARRTKVIAMQARAEQAHRMVDIAKAQVERHEAAHHLDEINLKRKRELHAGNAIPQQALDEAVSAHTITEAELKIAHARVAGAQADGQAVEAEVAVARADAMVADAQVSRLRTVMGYATIKAPFDGVITRRLVDPGAFVRSAADGATQPLLTISEVDKLRLVLDIPEPDAPFVRVGTAIDIVVKAVGGEPISSTIARTAVALNPATRTMRAEVDLDNSDGRLASGMFVRASLTLETKQGAMVLPAKAIRVRGRDVSVMVASEGVARAVAVKIGYDDGIWVEVLSELSETASVIVAAGGSLAPGAPVAPSPLGM